jgi:hypothetical protein
VASASASALALLRAFIAAIEACAAANALLAFFASVAVTRDGENGFGAGAPVRADTAGVERTGVGASAGDVVPTALTAPPFDKSGPTFCATGTGADAFFIAAEARSPD